MSSSTLEAISELTLTGDNYDEAAEILQKRFWNKQLIINKHMEKLLNVSGFEKRAHFAQNANFWHFSSCHHAKTIRALGFWLGF